MTRETMTIALVLLLAWGAGVAYLRFSTSRKALALLLACFLLLGGAWAVSGRLSSSHSPSQAPEGEVYHRHLRAQAEAWLDRHLTPYFLSLACPRRAVPRARLGEGQAQPQVRGDDYQEWLRRQGRAQPSSPSSLLRELARARERRRVYPPMCWRKARGMAEAGAFFVTGLVVIGLAAVMSGRKREGER